MTELIEPWWDKVLLTDGHWTLERMSPPSDPAGYRGRRASHVSLVKHVCYPDGMREGLPAGSMHQVVCYPDNERLCWRCGEVIPEGMVACWKMQNWEQLEYGS